MEWILLMAVVVVLAGWLFYGAGSARTEPGRSSAAHNQSSHQRTAQDARANHVATPTNTANRLSRRAEHSGGGILGYHGLLEWWHTEFNEDERQHIDQAFQPMGFSARGLEHGDIQHSSQSAVAFLSGLAGWFEKQHERPLAYRILGKAERVMDDKTPVLDRHFMYGRMVKLYYKDRADQDKMEKAIEACRNQVAMGEEAAAAFQANDRFNFVPSHPGFHQLAIILEKRGDFQDAIDLCRKAERQGWAGDWERRIERCERKLSKRA